MAKLASRGLMSWAAPEFELGGTPRNWFTRGPRFMNKPIRKAVLPVAGLGTRFLPATKTIPKEMLCVVDRPILQHVIDEARAAGVEQFIFVTGRNKGVIEDHF